MINQQFIETTSSLCQFLDWDSELFGYRLARATVNRLNSDSLREIMLWCRSHAIDCLYFLGDIEDAATLQLAEEHKFRLVDLRITLDTQIKRSLIQEWSQPSESVRACLPSDISTLRAIARISHHDSRFYYDLHFPRSRCDELYETWIEKSCGDYADEVLVAELAGRLVGYISCHVRNQGQGTGQIGLIAVSPEAQGQGIGQQLVKEALRWFAAQAVQQVTVVTQGRNSRAQRLYERCGFLTRSIQVWYHYWRMHD